MGALCAHSKDEELVSLSSVIKPIKPLKPQTSFDTDWFEADKETLYREN